jgi:hypothetical protein
VDRSPRRLRPRLWGDGSAERRRSRRGCVSALELAQIGKENKNLTPVTREKRAIEDIESAFGLKYRFHPYNR